VIDLSVDQAALEGVATALRYEQDGKQLRKDLVTNLKAAVEPALPVIRSGLMTMSTHSRVTPALRTVVLSKLKVTTRTTGDRAGVRVAIGKAGMPRGFKNAPRRLNKPEGWRHPLFGRRDKPWVAQRGAPGYFDRPLEERQDEMRAAVVQAVQDMSERIARRAGRG
jgi:hypothetical protein